MPLDVEENFVMIAVSGYQAVIADLPDLPPVLVINLATRGPLTSLPLPAIYRGMSMI